MDAVIICLLILSILLIFLWNSYIIANNFIFMEQINIEDGVGKLCLNGMNELNQNKIFVKNVVYKIYFKNSIYGYEPLLFKYVEYDNICHRFDELYTSSMYDEGMLARVIFVKVYGHKNDMKYTTSNRKEILKIIAAPEYAL